MNREQEVKDRLHELWSKPSNNGFSYQRIKLGRGVMRIPTQLDIQTMLTTIEDFGIPMKEFHDLNLTYEQIHEVYLSITTYRMAVRFLKGFKERLSWK